MRLRTVLAAGAAIAALATAAPAMATIVLSEGPCGPCGLRTVHLVDNVVGDDFVNGTLGGVPGVDVLFSSDEVIKVTGGPGQAWVGGADGTTEDLEFQVVGHTFDALEFNLNTINGRPVTYGATITGVDQNNVSFTHDFTGLTHDQFFNLKASGGEHITDMFFRIDGTPTNGSHILAAGQFRVGGISGVVPEPSVWALMVVGFGGAGALLRRRRRQAAIA
jgi:hypothetical protein